MAAAGGGSAEGALGLSNRDLSWGCSIKIKIKIRIRIRSERNLHVHCELEGSDVVRVGAFGNGDLG
jgi:hypothetical protein